MEKILKTILTVIGTIAICFVVALFNPYLKDAFILLFNVSWEEFKLFFLEDTVKSVIIYVVIAIIVTACGFGISHKTEKKIWSVVSIVVDILGLIGMIISLKK